MLRTHALATLTLMLTASSFAQANDPVAERLAATIHPQIQSGKSIGVAVGVFDLEKGPRFYSFGETRRGSSTPPTQDSLFEIGSITKTFTALLLGDAVMREEVDFEDRVEKYIPELTHHYTGSITLNQLVTHTSGLPALPCNLKAAGDTYTDYDEQHLLAGLTDASLVETECDVGPHPSKKIVYSNWGTALLGYILGRAQHLSFPELMAQRITAPLGLKDTFVFPSGDQRSRMAQGYDPEGYETPFSYRKVMFGNGAMLSSARDFFRYLGVQLGTIATPLAQTIALSHRPRFYDDKSVIALGWFIWEPQPPGSGFHTFSHDGAMDGFTSSFYFNLRERRGFFYLANSAHRPTCIQEAIEGRACHP